MTTLAIQVHPGALLSIVAFALLIGWILWRWALRSQDPPHILLLKIVVSVTLSLAAAWCILNISPYLGVPLAAVCGVIIGLLWGRNVGLWLAKPLTDLFDGGDEAPEPTPFYAIAHAHRKQARYSQAVSEIEKQLERFPGDFQGLILLAEIRALNLGDWDGAAELIEEIVSNPTIPSVTRARALQALADWQLDHARDLDAARLSIQRIIDLFPDSPEATEAAQRLGHLGDTHWRKSHRQPVRVRIPPAPELRSLGLRNDPQPEPQEADPEIEADQLRAHLGRHPLDAEAREQLALLYAHRMGRLDWALGEFDQLLDQPNRPPKLVARWLNQMAELHIRCAGDESAARRCLQRIVDAYPDTALAATAQSRMERLKLELRALKVTPRLGSP